MNTKPAAYSLKIDGRKMDDGNSRLFSTRSEHASLKDAVKTLRRLGDMVFDEAIVKERNLPQHIQNAVIQDIKDHQIILTKHHFRGSDYFGLPASVLIRLNEVKMSPGELKRQSGLDLTKYPKLGDHSDYFVVASREALQKEYTPLKKIVYHAGKVLKSLKGNGRAR